MKIPKCRDKFLRGIYLHSIVKGKMKQCKHPRIYMKNMHRGAEREPLNQRDYKEFSSLCYRFNSLEFDSLLRRKRLAFVAEG